LLLPQFGDRFANHSSFAVASTTREGPASLVHRVRQLSRHTIVEPAYIDFTFILTENAMNKYSLPILVSKAVILRSKQNKNRAFKLYMS
jgi:hypothetical protein